MAQVEESKDPKAQYAKMGNVVSFNISGMKMSDISSHKAPLLAMEKVVEDKVKSILTKLKSSGEKFTDEDFGPTEEDEFGGKSLYGAKSPDPAGHSKYPSPESLSWIRPQYADDTFDSKDGGAGEDSGQGEDGGEEDDMDDDMDDFEDYGGALYDESESFCTEGRLFVDGSSSGDVIQGQLGDCWFLGALAVMGTRENLLQECFWKLDAFKEHGMFVCRFFKDSYLIYVIIDDRIPCNAKNSNINFAKCKDANELWVPLIEKAYAKLHGNYKALIGGYSHNALGDMTGYSPRLVGLKPGHMGYVLTPSLTLTRTPTLTRNRTLTLTLNRTRTGTPTN